VFISLSKGNLHVMQFYWLWQLYLVVT